MGAGGGGAGAAALGAGGGGAGAPAFLICGISAWGVGGGPPTAAMAARTRAAKASSAQIEKALTDFLGCARTNARARTLSEPEAARRAESAAALMEEEIAKDMMVVGCVCGAEGVRRRGSTWRLDTRFGWFSFVVAACLKLAKLAQRLASVRFNAKWHAASSARVPGGGRLPRVLSTFASSPETPRRVHGSERLRLGPRPLLVRLQERVQADRSPPVADLRAQRLASCVDRNGHAPERVHLKALVRSTGFGHER